MMMGTKDAESGMFLPPDTVYVTTVAGVDYGDRRNTDGLKIPDHKRSFNVLVGMYKVLLALYSVMLVFGALWIVCMLVMASRFDDLETETQEEKERIRAVVMIFSMALPLFLLAFMVGILENVIGWLGMCTLRMCYLRLDFGIQCLMWTVWLLNLMFGMGFTGVGLVFWQMFQTILIFLIIREIRIENDM